LTSLFGKGRRNFVVHASHQQAIVDEACPLISIILVAAITATIAFDWV